MYYEDYLRYHKWRTASDDWRYNKVNKVKIICEGLESLPDELRYLCWHGYPLKSLPLKFNPEHLVDLEMPHSKLQHLRKDTKFLGKKLRRIDLGGCRQLTEVLDLSQAINLDRMELGCCSSLTKFPKISSNATLTRLCLTETGIEEVPYSAIKSLSKIVKLYMGSNKRLRNLPSMRHLTSLEKLDLSGCSNITEFPEISGAITDLYLRETSIEEVPYLAIKSLSKIVSLNFSSNTRLKNLPSMRHLTSLETLCLDGCSNITEFPEISGAITFLYLSGTAIEEVPYSAIKSLSKIVELDMRSNTRLRNLPSMCHLTSLQLLNLKGCSNITEFPDVSGEIAILHLSETGIEEVPSFVGRLTNHLDLTLMHCKRLKKVSSSIFQLKLGWGGLDLSGCSKLESFPEVLENEGMLPSSIELLNGIRQLYMRYCKNLESLPNSLCNLSKLEMLGLCGCPGVEKMLENVLLSSPSGLRSLKGLDLSECNMEVLPTALSRLSSLDSLYLRGNEFESLSLELFTSLRKLDISNCKRLRYLQDFPLPSRLEVFVAGNCTSLETGSSMKIDLPPNWYNDKFVGFAMCIVASCKPSNHIVLVSYVKCECKIKDPDCDGQYITFRFPNIVIEHPKSDHVFIKSIMPSSVRVSSESDYSKVFDMTDPIFNPENSFSWQKARFRFSTSESCCKVKSHDVIGKEEEEDCYSESEVSTLCRSGQGRPKVR
ncbi:hypothetical protein EZV62_022887 [Acer yangbiense]|uniref:C-JID domain-containing protein n=1 Tax=Acer yangbiense TaxID=1000413 RepID=A0A5C7H0B6_9ROSI|nr:hypothetical protein EZV62_022887 [Acer yangbiense]